MYGYWNQNRQPMGCCYTMPAQYRYMADCSSRYMNQLYHNNNHIYFTQPIINDRNHLVNHLNRTIIRDNNYHHYRVTNMYKQNVINRYYNQIYRMQRHFCDYSCTQSIEPGTCTSTEPVNVYLDSCLAQTPALAVQPSAVPALPAPAPAVC